MGIASSERKVRVGGMIPHLPRAESDRIITRAVNFNLVLPGMTGDKQDVVKGPAEAIGKPKKEKPPPQRTGTCGRCGQPMYYREGWTAEHCFGCSGD